MKVTYLTEPSLSPVGYESEWKLTADWVVHLDDEDGTQEIFTIPAGFTTDLASVPRLPGMFWLFGGKARRAAILHDFLYSTHYPRRRADLVFRMAMEGEVPTWARWIMWAAVRVGGGAYYP